jgi:large subunit ribosomal protein L3e
MIGAGVIGYMLTPLGIRHHSTVWASHIAEAAKRRFYKDNKTKKNAFTKHETNATQHPEELKEKLEKIKKECCCIRIIAHTQPELTNLDAKKAQIIEI